MRPCGYELIKGLIYTWEKEALPVVSQSGQEEIARRMIGGSTVLRLVAALWEKEGASAYYGNRELRGALKKSMTALKKAGLDDVAGEVGKQLAGQYIMPGEYPGLNALLKEADDLKAVLEKVLIAVAGVKKPGKPLVKAHDNLRSIMKLRIERDMHLDNIIRGDYTHLEKDMDEFIHRLYP